MAKPDPSHLTAPLVVHTAASDAELQGMAFGTVYLAECVQKLIEEVAVRASRAERLRKLDVEGADHG